MGYQDVVMSDAPLAYFPLQESSGTAVSDVVNRSNAGVLTPGTASALGATGVPSMPLTGKAASFDNTGHIQFPSLSAYGWRNPFSVEAWVYPTQDVTGPMAIVTKNAAGQQEWIFNVNCQNPGLSTTIEVYRDQAGNAYGYAYTSTSTFQKNTWTYVAGTWNGTQMDVFVNGVVVTNTRQTLTGTANTGLTSALDIGSYGNSSGSYPFKFTGKIAHVALYGTALSAAQILVHYKEGLRGGVVL